MSGRSPLARSTAMIVANDHEETETLKNGVTVKIRATSDLAAALPLARDVRILTVSSELT